MTRTHRLVILIFSLIFLPALLFASQGGDLSHGSESLTHQMTRLVIQLAVILFATWIGGRLAQKIRLPGVIGQLLMGIIIGPFLLGGVGIPGFPQGLFPVLESTISVSPLVYSLSSLAAIILLFIAGLETDLPLFLKYAGKGSVVGLGGVLFSFVSGAWLSTFFTGYDLFHPVSLFMGTLSVATSVGITASILSDQRKMDSPEGVVILSAAVIDDVLGIIILAIVLGLAAILPGSGESAAGINWGEIAWVGVKAVGVWLVFTILGLVFARKLGRFLKQTFKDQSLVTVMAFALALLMAGIFESAGLSMIIGAYVVGLTLSNTDLAFVIQSRLRTLHDFFVPIFFAVSGMMVNLEAIANGRVLGFGLLFTLVAIVAKLIGSGGPALMLNFNLLGASRIGLGMVPRGEVALIMAGIGMSSGIINQEQFGIALLMTIISTIAAPPALNHLLRIRKSGQNEEEGGGEKTETSFSFQSPEFAQLIITTFTAEMEKEGFFINNMEHGEEVIQMRKDDIFISLYIGEDGEATFLSDEKDVNLFKTALYESLLSVNNAAGALKKIFKPDEMAKSISSGSTGGGFDIIPYTSPDFVIRNLRAHNKQEVIEEMLYLADAHELLDDGELVKHDVLEREKSMTTGMANGVAIPHAKTEGVSSMHFLIGLKPDGVDFESLDGKPSNIFIMILTPKQGHGPHIQLMSSITGLLNRGEVREAVLNAETSYEVLRILNRAQEENQAQNQKKTRS